MNLCSLSFVVLLAFGGAFALDLDPTGLHHYGRSRRSLPDCLFDCGSYSCFGGGVATCMQGRCFCPASPQMIAGSSLHCPGGDKELCVYGRCFCPLLLENSASSPFVGPQLGNPSGAQFGNPAGFQPGNQANGLRDFGAGGQFGGPGRCDCSGVFCPNGGKPRCFLEECYCPANPERTFQLNNLQNRNSQWTGFENPQRRLLRRGLGNGTVNVPCQPNDPNACGNWKCYGNQHPQCYRGFCRCGNSARNLLLPG